MSHKLNEQQLQDLFTDFAAENMSEAMALVAGLFVGLYLVAAESVGADPDKEIVVNGMGSRNITIHELGHVIEQKTH